MRYKVDLKRYMAECEANYAQLLRLIPDLSDGVTKRIRLQHGEHQLLQFNVLEKTPYTSLVALEPVRERASGSRWLKLPILRVRLYHDAQVAEVVHCDGFLPPYPRCEYPNMQMHQRDEKAQWSRFLSEWLSQCVRHAYCAEVPFEPVGNS